MRNLLRSQNPYLLRHVQSLPSAGGSAQTPRQTPYPRANVQDTGRTDRPPERRPASSTSRTVPQTEGLRGGSAVVGVVARPVVGPERVHEAAQATLHPVVQRPDGPQRNPVGGAVQECA